MAIVTVVEPNPLLLLGILQILRTMAPSISSEGFDYDQLFKGITAPRGSDLMLLSVPTDYDRMIELTNAAQRGYCPKRILLLSDTSVLPYSLADLPLSLAGFVSKHSSQSILAAAIALALAGGKCFPPPDAFTRDRGEPESGDRQAKTDIPRRRWYDKDLPPPEFSPLETVFVSSHARPDPQSLQSESHSCSVPLQKPERRAPARELAADESRLLGLTPRQYEVLACLARGLAIKEIGCELNISMATTKAHLESLYKRLSVHNRYAAVHVAYSHGATLGCRN